MVKKNLLEEAVLNKHEFLKKSKILDADFDFVKEVAAKRFRLLGFPSNKSELFSYINIKKLIPLNYKIVTSTEKKIKSFDFKKHCYSNCDLIVTMNGQFIPEFSNYKLNDNVLKIIPIKQEISELKEKLISKYQNENDILSLINGIFMENGVIIRVNGKSNRTLQILHLSSGSFSKHNEICMNFPFVYIHLEKNSKLELVNKYIGNDKYYINSSYEVILDEGASLNINQLQFDPNKCFHFTKFRIIQGKKSHCSLLSLTKGDELVRHHIEVHLKKEAHFYLKALNILINEEESHYYVRVYHKDPLGISKQVFRNILKNKSHSGIDTTVIVEKDAQLVNSEQMINNLMLSSEARANTKPNLMIYADDVKCAHGATIGQIQDKELLYLRSRGISKENAKKLLIHGFANVILSEITNSKIFSDIQEFFLSKLG